jgi:hypothetical protein
VNLTKLLVDDVEVVDQPLGRGRDCSATLDCFDQNAISTDELPAIVFEPGQQ